MKGTWDADRDPLAALRAGDASLFEAFVRREAGQFTGFFVRLGAGAEEAEDLAQETFLKMFRARDTYQPQERFTAYAYRVARNAWVDRVRRNAVRPRPAAGWDPSSEGPPPEEHVPDRRGEVGRELSLREEAARLCAALTQLSDGHRAVFELGVVQELSYPEISAALDVPVGTVKSRMFHAVRKLRALLGDEPEARGATAESRGEQAR